MHVNSLFYGEPIQFYTHTKLEKWKYSFHKFILIQYFELQFLFRLLFAIHLIRVQLLINNTYNMWSMKKIMEIYYYNTLKDQDYGWWYCVSPHICLLMFLSKWPYLIFINNRRSMWTLNAILTKVNLWSQTYMKVGNVKCFFHFLFLFIFFVVCFWTVIWERQLNVWEGNYLTDSHAKFESSCHSYCPLCNLPQWTKAMVSKSLDSQICHKQNENGCFSSIFYCFLMDQHHELAKFYSLFHSNNQLLQIHLRNIWETKNQLVT